MKNQYILVFASLEEMLLLYNFLKKELNLNELLHELKKFITFFENKETNHNKEVFLHIPIQEALSLIKPLIQANNPKLKRILYDIMKKALSFKK